MNPLNSFFLTRPSLFKIIITVFAMIWLSACMSEPERCPPTAHYDADRERCVSTDNNVDNNDESDAGEDATDQDPEDANPPIDAAIEQDTLPPEDAGPDSRSRCDEITCGDSASCAEGFCVCNDGYEGDPDDECFAPQPCDEECSFGATCLDDQCHCDPGFTTIAEGCELTEVGEPQTRTENQVCERWNEDRWSLTNDKWAQEPQDQCDWGWLSEAYHLEAIAETTRYRWLVGLPAVTASESARTTTQACATTLAAENTGLTHNITQDFACYSSEAASGASSSNIASGSVSAADTVRRYIEDWNTPSLGHRRWLFNPRMGQTAFGIRDGYSCNYAFDTSGPASPEYTAYPAPGYFPKQALHGKWSLSSNSLSLGADSLVTVENLSTGSTIDIHDFSSHAASSYRPPMISWRLTQAPVAGESYQVTIADARGDGDDLVYEVFLVNC